MNSLTPASLPADTNTGENSPYDDWAWLYNRSVGRRYGETQWRFLQRALLPAVPDQAHLLDLCCGSGQLMQPLLERGYRVTGLDGSAAMLQYARNNCPRADIILGDARRFELQAMFDGIYSTSASLNHIENLDQLLQVFRCVYQALRPGGRFVFDLNHPRQLHRWWRGRPTEGEINSSYAWVITPHYCGTEHRGRFTVTIYTPQPQRTRVPGRLRRYKSGCYRLLARPRFIGLRLKLLQHFEWLEPNWQRQDIDYPITGHDIDGVTKTLQKAGFTGIRLETVDGQGAPDENHSAHFICDKEML